MRTYDIHFNDEQGSNSKGWATSYKSCYDYIKSWNGTDHSYFADYRKGTVSIVCNQDGKTLYEINVK